MGSTVHRVITKKTLLLGIPRDYLALIALLTGAVFGIAWYALYLTGLTGRGVVYAICLVVALVTWGFGAIKAKADPEFLSVHIAKLTVPAKTRFDALMKYLIQTDIHP